VAKLQPVRGTRDIYGEDALRFREVVDTFTRVAKSFGFGELSTPIFEFTDVFKRPLGDASDIVSKEMYCFEDRGGEELTLRPEFTAGVSRSFISNGLQEQLPCRFMSYGPVFRYERPQKGRYRQFHQINAECIGPADAGADVDLIVMGWTILQELGVADDIVLNINSLGDTDSRAAYRDALVAYFSDHKDKLSEDSVRRLTSNPLRILDSKNEGDKAIVADAPALSNYLNDTSSAFFDSVKAGLTASGVPFVHNERLVRGLDYYTHTAFEFITDSLGAQGTVLAGGRYDGLIQQLGGPPTAAVGWAGGIERLAMMIKEPAFAPRPVMMIPMGDSANEACYSLAATLRGEGIAVISDRSGNLKKRLNRANKAGASHAVILGDNEIEQNVVTVRNLDEGSQQEIALDGAAALVAAVKG